MEALPDPAVVVVSLQVGHVGLWTVDEEDDSDAAQGVFEFKPHTQSVPRIAFDPLNGNKMITTSYDGTVRRMDVEKGTFERVSGWVSLEVGCCTAIPEGSASPRVRTTRPEIHARP